MSATRNATARAVAAGRLPAPNPDRVLLIEKAAARLQDRDSGTIDEAEPWDDFLKRIGVLGDQL
jgi:hypothetical protein